VRRATIAFGIVAILASSCGESDLPAPLAGTLQDHVAQIRSFAEAGRPGLARTELRRLGELVASRLEAGRIEDGRATAILAAAQAVEEQLALVPRPSPSASPTTSPIDEGDENDEGGGEGKPDKDKGNGNGKGNGDEGHGNDD
jgi:hypothetical protein